MPRMRPRVLEALVLSAGKESETYRSVITRVLIVVACVIGDQNISHLTCSKSTSVIDGLKYSRNPFMFLYRR